MVEKGQYNDNNVLAVCNTPPSGEEENLSNDITAIRLFFLKKSSPTPASKGE